MFIAKKFNNFPIQGTVPVQLAKIVIHCDI